MAISNRELELTNSLLSLQQSYNEVLRDRDNKNRQLSVMANTLFDKEMIVYRLNDRIRLLSHSLPTTSYVPFAWCFLNFQYSLMFYFLFLSYSSPRYGASIPKSEALHLHLWFKESFLDASAHHVCRLPF